MARFAKYQRAALRGPGRSPWRAKSWIMSRPPEGRYAPRAGQEVSEGLGPVGADDVREEDQIPTFGPGPGDDVPRHAADPVPEAGLPDDLPGHRHDRGVVDDDR